MAWPQATFTKQTWGDLASFLSAMCVAINEREVALDEAETKFTIADGTRKTNPTEADFAGLVFARVRDTDPGTGTISSTVKDVTGVGTAFRVAGTGTIDSSGVNVTGTSTVFLSELEPGDTITADSQDRIVDEITLDSALTTTVAFSPALSSESFEVPGEIKPGEILTADDQDRIVDEVTSATELTTKAPFDPALSADAFEVPGDGDRIQGILIELQAACRVLTDGYGDSGVSLDTKYFVATSTDTEQWLYRDIIGSNSVGGEVSTSGTVTSSSETVTGVGTSFLSEVNIGDVIASGSATPGNEYREIVSIESDTSLTIDAEFDPVMSGDPMPIVRGFGHTFNWWKATTWERLRQYIDAMIYCRVIFFPSVSNSFKSGSGATNEIAWDAARVASPAATTTASCGWFSSLSYSELIRGAATVTFSTTDYSGAVVSNSGALYYTNGQSGGIRSGADISYQIAPSGDSNITGTITTSTPLGITIGPIVASGTTAANKTITTTITTSEPATSPHVSPWVSSLNYQSVSCHSFRATIDLSSALTDQA